jgi:hypothetical protein
MAITHVQEGPPVQDGTKWRVIVEFTNDVTGEVRRKAFRWSFEPTQVQIDAVIDAFKVRWQKEIDFEPWPGPTMSETFSVELDSQIIKAFTWIKDNPAATKAQFNAWADSVAPARSLVDPDRVYTEIVVRTKERGIIANTTWADFRDFVVATGINDLFFAFGV